LTAAHRTLTLPLRRVSVACAGRTGTVTLLALLLAASLFLRTRVLDASFWIDEGLSVGISSHPLVDIPGVLRQDGSPPLYYVLLHLWLALVGPGEAQTHALSLLFALLAVPAAYWAAASIFGPRAGWICAALAAVNPFLTAYAQETRMYTLVALLSLLATAAFLHGFVLGRRRYLLLFAALLAVLLYTHNWSLFFAAGAATAVLCCTSRAGRPARPLRDVLLVFGGAALVFAPWIPTLVFQALHTGAPWSRTPSLVGLLRAPSALLSGDTAAIALLVGGASGLVRILREAKGGERTAVLTTIVLTAATLTFAWGLSQLAPAWANRYLAVVLGPLLLLAAASLASAGRLGIVALALVLVFWIPYRAPDSKSNVREVVAKVEALLAPGDLVISTHPEQVPVLHYYLPRGLRYATTLGPVADPGVMDWRDALRRLRAAQPGETLGPLLARLPTGRRLLLVRPVIEEAKSWRAPWTSLVRRRSAEWATLVARDGRFVQIAGAAGSPRALKGVRALVYEKVRAAKGTRTV
jgi:mannosyltransferase